MDKRVALNQIGTAKARLDEYFPQYKDIIEGTSIYLLPKENQLEERNQIAVELGAKSKVNIENTAAETINGSKATAIIVYFETLNQEQFVHFLFHEFGHVLSLNSNRTLYAEALKATESKNITSFSAGFAVWGELIAEAIAFRVEGKMPDDVPSTAVIRIQQELDAAVNVPFELVYMLLMLGNKARACQPGMYGESSSFNSMVSQSLSRTIIVAPSAKAVNSCLQ